jgi:hypothetical protein
MLIAAWWPDRATQSAVLLVPADRLLQRPLDTLVVLPASGRYQLMLGFTIPPGEARRALDSAAPVAEFSGDINGRRWSTQESGGSGTFGTGDTAGFILGRMTGERGDTVRLTLRVSTALTAWLPKTPTIELRRDFLDAKDMLVRKALGQWLGFVLIAASTFAAWRTRRRERTN